MHSEGAVACQLREPWLAADGQTAGALDIAAVIPLGHLSTQTVTDATMETDDTAATNGFPRPPVGRTPSPPRRAAPRPRQPPRPDGRCSP